MRLALTVMVVLVVGCAGTPRSRAHKAKMFDHEMNLMMGGYEANLAKEEATRLKALGKHHQPPPAPPVELPRDETGLRPFDAFQTQGASWAPGQPIPEERQVRPEILESFGVVYTSPPPAPWDERFKNIRFKTQYIQEQAINAAHEAAGVRNKFAPAQQGRRMLQLPL
jgi:hypothetical protein